MELGVVEWFIRFGARHWWWTTGSCEWLRVRVLAVVLQVAVAGRGFFRVATLAFRLVEIDDLLFGRLLDGRRLHQGMQGHALIT